MHFLAMNQRWIALPLSMISAIFYAPVGEANPTSNSQTTPLIAQSTCSAKDLSRSTPPFPCLNPKAFSCLKKNNTGNGGSIEYRGDISGEIAVKSNVVGQVALLEFNYNQSTQTLNLNVKQKNFLVQEQQIWDGFKNTLSKCR